VELSFFADNNPRGFGLLQRDRRLESYEDEEANYHLRPSLWIEPVGDWGRGSVMLMEIPTAHELSDNLTAMWVPEGEILAGTRLEFRYRQHWTMDVDPSEAGGLVVATRTGVHEWQPNQRTIVVEFAGERLRYWPEDKPLEPVVEVLGSQASRVRILNPVVHQLQDGRWRLAFQIEPSEEDTALESIGPLEFRATLRSGDEFPAETWSYRLKP
jgi:glucans biosynthesis protein